MLLGFLLPCYLELIRFSCFCQRFSCFYANHWLAPTLVSWVLFLGCVVSLMCVWCCLCVWIRILLVFQCAFVWLSKVVSVFRPLVRFVVCRTWVFLRPLFFLWLCGLPVFCTRFGCLGWSCVLCSSGGVFFRLCLFLLLRLVLCRFLVVVVSCCCWLLLKFAGRGCVVSPCFVW